MKLSELSDWLILYNQVKNGWHLSDSDKQELLRLNHIVMEQAHKIHNDNMLKVETVK